MFNSTLLEHFRLLTQEEIKEFELFVAADLHNNGRWKEETRALVAIIASCYPDFTSKKLDKDFIYPRIFPGKAYIKGNLPKVMTELNQLLKDYVVWRAGSKKENEFFHNLEWARFVRTRGREERYLLAFDKVKKYQIENPQESPEFFYRNYLVELEAAEWQSVLSRQKDDVNLLKVLESLNLFYLTQGLKTLNTALILQKHTLFDISEQLKSNFEKVLSSVGEQDSVFLSLLIQFNQIIQKNTISSDDLNIFANLLRNSGQKLSFEIVQESYSNLRNLYTLLIDAGNEHLYADVFEIYKENLEKGYVHIDGKIPSNIYISISRVALIQGEYDWANMFIENHKGRVWGESDAMEFYWINKSQYYFAIGDTEKALDILPASVKNITYQLIIKRLEIKCYYEIKSEMLVYKLDAFKVYISRFSNKILSNEIRLRSFGFCNVVYQLMLYRYGNKQKVQKIKARVLADTHIAERVWLTQKVEELL